MDIYREINNNDFLNKNDIILKHIYHNGSLSIDELSLEDALMYDEEREEYYAMCTISLRDLQRSVENMNSSIEYWSEHPDDYRNGAWIERMKEARDIFKKELDEQEDTFYIVRFDRRR